MSATPRVSEATERPWIKVSDIDHERLSGLATAVIDIMPGIASRLLTEMERAEIVRHERLPESVVAMGSTVVFMDHGDRPRRVQLVYPDDADIVQGKVSVMAPVGTALIGLSVGQSITWLGVDGRERWLTVLGVEPPPIRDPVRA